jgi:hypothetical protein
MKCSKRVAYVSTLSNELCFASCRSGLETPAPRFPLVSRQAQLMAVCSEIFYE